MMAPLKGLIGDDPKVLVGPETADDAGVYLVDGIAMVATVDFITPVCDDPVRFGRVAAANSISDVYAMGGTPLFALNLCCFPEKVPQEALTGILQGAAEILRTSGAALLGGHTVADRELKFGLAVLGRVDPERMLTNAAARCGDRLVLTKPLGTGVLINAFKKQKIDEATLEPALVEMERLNAQASAAAIEHGARAATDVTGFGLAGHAFGMARASGVGVELSFDALPVYGSFYDVVRAGVSTGSTKPNRANVEEVFEDRAGLDALQSELLFDPQTSGGLLIAVEAGRVPSLLETLAGDGHTAVEVGRVVDGPARIIVV